MEQRELPIDLPSEVRPSAPGVPDNADRNRQTEVFIAAGQAAIDRSLSNNSQQYLSQHRQKGGE